MISSNKLKVVELHKNLILPDGFMSPSHVFKYRSLAADNINYTLAILRDQELYFSPREKLKDPFDCLLYSRIDSENELYIWKRNFLRKHNIIDECEIKRILSLTVYEILKMEESKQERIN